MSEARQRLKVLVAVDSLGEGGAERSVAEELTHYRKAGVCPIVVCLRHSDQGVEQWVRAQRHDVRVLPESRLNIGSSLFDSFLTRVRALRKVIAAESPDLIHTTLPRSSLVGRVAAAGTGVPVLSSLVNTRYGAERLKDPATSRWKLKALQAVDACSGHLLTDHFHALTNTVKEAAVAKLWLPEAKITVIERGRDAERLGRRSESRRRRARHQLGLGETDEVLINVARQDYQKGQEHLLEAMRPLMRERPKLVLLVAGRRGAASPKLDRMRRHPSLSGNRVRFLGHRDDVPDLLAAADLFVFPSLFEGLGGAVIEAMALALPIVASDIAPMREINERGRNALLVESGAPRELADAIGQLLDDSKRSRRFGRRSREIFEKRFTLEQSAARMVDLYRKVAYRGSVAHA